VRSRSRPCPGPRVGLGDPEPRGSQFFRQQIGGPPPGLDDRVVERFDDDPEEEAHEELPARAEDAGELVERPPDAARIVVDERVPRQHSRVRLVRVRQSVDIPEREGHRGPGLTRMGDEGGHAVDAPDVAAPPGEVGRPVTGAAPGVEQGTVTSATSAGWTAAIEPSCSAYSAARRV
jgi:hypothetical protein